MYVFCCTANVGVCIVLCPALCADVCVVFCVRCGCTFCDVHYVYVYVIEEKQRHWVLVECGNQSGVCKNR